MDMNNSTSTRIIIGILVLTAVLACLVVLFIPPYHQDQDYHRFADDRFFFGIPHAGDVLTHVAYLAVGVLGLGWMLSKRGGRREGAFRERSEAWSYYVFFTGFLLTTLGSTWYHLNPSDNRLFGDRLPMAITFMSLFCIVISERISIRAGKILLPILLVTGVGSVVFWRITGDLRPYGLVQFYPMVALPLMLILLPPHYSKSGYFWLLFVWYAVSKVCEVLDRQMYDWTGFVSGHNLKHIFVAISVLSIYLMLRQRTILK